MSGLVLDLFAGPGGWDEGVRPLGLRPVGIEWDDAACRTGKAAGHVRVRADVAALPTEPMVGKVRGLIASPPCQTFSMAGKGKGRDALPELQDAVERVWNGATPQEVCPVDLDPRSVLVLEPVRYARDLRPEWIACEQVPAVLPIWQAFAVVLRAHAYSVWVGVLNSADYGVPQTRQRAILIASRVRQVAPPPPTHTKGGEEPDLFGDQLEPWVSMARALGWGHQDKPSVTLLAGGTATGGAEPYGPREREALRQVVLRNGNQANACERTPDEPAGTLFFGGRMNDVSWVVRTGNNSRQGGGTTKDYERNVDEPSPTLTGNVNRWVVSAGVTGEGRPKDPETQPADTICGKGTAYWTGTERPAWTDDRPATTVQGDPRIWPPGHKLNADDLRRDPRAAERYGNRAGKRLPDWSVEPATTILSGHNRSTSELPNGAGAGAVRVTVEEAAVLQSFPAEYPWQGLTVPCC